MNRRITIGIPAKDRGIELSLLLYSLLEQTYQEFDILIIDDFSSNFLYENTTFKSLLKLHENINHKVTIIKGDKKGPHYAGQLLLENSKSDFILRLDDDVTLQQDCIEKLINCFEDKEVIASGPIYILPFKDISEQIIDLDELKCYKVLGSVYLSDADHVNVNGALQMNILLNTKGNISVEHLHSGFMYKKSALEEIGGYFLGYSKVGHREETDTSYRLFKDGGKLVVCPDAVAFHYHPNFGGIRTDENGKPSDALLWENDEKLFIERFKNNFPMDDKPIDKSKSLNRIRKEFGIKPVESPVKVDPLTDDEKQLVEGNICYDLRTPVLTRFKPNIHLVTVTHGNHEKLKKLIESVHKYTEKDSYSWTVVNNDISEESKKSFCELIEKLNDTYGNCIQLKEEVSVSEARNIGTIYKPNVGYLCFIDDDVVILGKWEERDWLYMMCEKMKEELDIGAVGPIYTWFEPLKSHTLSVACMMIPVPVWEEIGGFDPIFGNKENGTWGYEDVDYSYRLQMNGYKIKGINHSGFPLYHEDTTFKKKAEWQEKGLIKGKELLLSKYDIEEIQKFNRTVYPFTREQIEIKCVKINIGCYYMKLDGFINIDVNPECQPNILGDIREIEFQDNSVGLILASQVLEHFNLMDVKDLLSKFHKWLCHGGHLIIEVPDVGYILDVVEKGEHKIENYYGAIYGNDEAIGMKHKSQFDETLLLNMLKEAGFNNIVRNSETSDNDEISLRFDIRK